MDKSLELLKDILEIPTVNSADSEKHLAEYIMNYFLAHGIESHVQMVDEMRANVYAFVPGRDKSRTVIWNGHLDTVPYGSLSQWDTDPAEAVIREGKLFARGSADMKSGLAAMVYALCHTKEAPLCSIQFIGTCDEEKGGLGARCVIESNQMMQSEYLLVGEPTGMRLGVAQKGCLWLEALVKGRTSHGAYPWEGINAIAEGMKLADSIRKFTQSYTHKLLGASTAQVTMIQGGSVPNMTADSCRIVMDIRMTPGLNAGMVLEYARKLVQQDDFQGEAEFRVLNSRRAIEIKSSHAMTAGLRVLVQAYGYDGEDVGINFFTDASLLDEEGRMNILLFGPGEPGMAHKPNEYVEVQNYQDAIQVLMEFMVRGFDALY